MLTSRLDFGVTSEDLLKGVGKSALAVVLAIVTIRVAHALVPRAVARLADATRRDDRWQQRTGTLSGLLISVVAVVVWTLAIFTVLDQLGLELAPLLAGAGVVGLAVGFGAQQLVRDVIAGFVVLVEDQYAVGDAVTVAGQRGTVESLTLRLTRIRGDDGSVHYLGNGELGTVTNHSRGYAVADIRVPVETDAGASAAVTRIERAMAALVASGELDEMLLADPQVLGITGLRGDTSTAATVTIRARVAPEARDVVERRLLQAALAAARGRTPRR